MRATQKNNQLYIALIAFVVVGILACAFVIPSIHRSKSAYEVESYYIGDVFHGDGIDIKVLSATHHAEAGKVNASAEVYLTNHGPEAFSLQNLREMRFYDNPLFGTPSVSVDGASQVLQPEESRVVKVYATWDRHPNSEEEVSLWFPPKWYAHKSLQKWEQGKRYVVICKLVDRS